MTSRCFCKKNGDGFSLPELLVVVAVIGVLFTVVGVMIRPEELRSKARDATRVVDMGVLHQAIKEYQIDNDFPPDVDDTTRASNVSTGGDFEDADGTGWIQVRLSDYLTKIPVDPLNSGDYVYRYRKSGKQYELEAQLEGEIDKMDNDYDGGDDDGKYELGTDLSLL